MKSRVTVTLDTELIKECKEKGINISQFMNGILRNKLRENEDKFEIFKQTLSVNKGETERIKATVKGIEKYLKGVPGSTYVNEATMLKAETGFNTADKID